MHRRRDVFVRLAFAVPLMAGCVQAPRLGTPSPAPANPAAAAVYEALIAELKIDRGAVYVESSSPQYHVGQQTARVGADSFPGALAQELEQLSRSARAANTRSLPTGVRIVSSEGSEQLQGATLGGTAVLALSPVVFSADSTDALVYYEVHCGGLCGHGALARFRRESGKWRFETSYRYWIGDRSRRASPRKLANVALQLTSARS